MDWSSSGITTWFRRHHHHTKLRVVGILILSQLVSLTLALLSLTSSLISQKFGVYAPLTQSLFVYASLALVYGTILLFRNQKPLGFWYWYLLLGIVDVQGNYLVNKAYQYSSITSVTLLDCWTIPWAILFTWIFLGTRYSLWQLSGAAICVLGLCLVMFSDSEVGGGGGSKPLLGDVLVIGGTLFYAISNVGENKQGKHTFKQVKFIQTLRLSLIWKLNKQTNKNCNDSNLKQGCMQTSNISNSQYKQLSDNTTF
ncbi:uncharacterized protein LOC130932679 isoform X1 [Arachis stenosperma]|uniref:uncharacterized protein LOC130932679 isoform X1 n=1 Tax=Arachis stenosperma TaxID=217475 RepID=UPI0025AC6BB9|nr:uncharacterized protein LOC130932679 isoform X1 [Arachis stenosperma]